MHGQLLRQQFHIPFNGRIIRRGCPLIEGIVGEARVSGLPGRHRCQSGAAHGRERCEERGSECHRNLSAA